MTRLALIALVTLTTFGTARATDQTNVNWVNDALLWNNALKVCTSSGYLTGTFCFPWGAAFECGTTSTITASTTETMSGSFSHSGVSIGFEKSHTMSQTFSYTAGNEVVQWMVCYANSTLRHWDCECFLFWGSWDCSVDIFTPGAATVTKCITPKNCNPGVAAGAGTADATTPANGTASVVIDLSTYLKPASGTPPIGDPLAEPSEYYSMLNQPQRCHIAATVAEAAGLAGLPIAEVVIKNVDGSMHVFDMFNDPDPFGCAPAEEFLRGDCNGDNATNIADAVRVLNTLFPFGCTPGVDCPTFDCPDACDCNDDGTNNIADAVCILNVLFPFNCTPGINCPVFPTPGNAACGADPTSDQLAACVYTCP